MPLFYHLYRDRGGGEQENLQIVQTCTPTSSGNSSGDCQYCGQSPPPFNSHRSSSDEAPPTYTQVVQISPDLSQGTLTPTSSLIRVVPVLIPPSPVRTPVENTDSAISVPTTPAAEHAAEQTALLSGASTDSDSVSDVQSVDSSCDANSQTCALDRVVVMDSAEADTELPSTSADSPNMSSSTVVDMHVTPSGYSFVTRIR